MELELEPYDFEASKNLEKPISQKLQDLIIKEFKLKSSEKPALVSVVVWKNDKLLPEMSKPAIGVKEEEISTDVGLSPHRGRVGFVAGVAGSHCVLRYVGGKPRLYCWKSPP